MCPDLRVPLSSSFWAYATLEHALRHVTAQFLVESLILSAAGGAGGVTAASSARPGPTTPVADLSQERIKRWPVPGGLINEYEQAA